MNVSRVLNYLISFVFTNTGFYPSTILFQYGSTQYSLARKGRYVQENCLVIYSFRSRKFLKQTSALGAGGLIGKFVKRSDCCEPLCHLIRATGYLT